MTLKSILTKGSRAGNKADEIAFDVSKWRLRGQQCLHAGDLNGGYKCFKRALEICPGDEMLKKGCSLEGFENDPKVALDCSNRVVS